MFFLPPKILCMKVAIFLVYIKKSLNRHAYAMKVMVISYLSNASKQKQQQKNFYWEVKIFLGIINRSLAKIDAWIYFQVPVAQKHLLGYGICFAPHKWWYL